MGALPASCQKALYPVDSRLNSIIQAGRMTNYYNFRATTTTLEHQAPCENSSIESNNLFSNRMSTLGRVMFGLLGLLVCVVSSQAYAIHSRGDVEVMTTGDKATDTEMLMPDMMTAEEEAEVDEMFPDQMRDDLKLELILKALQILKTYEGHSVSLSGWFPSYDVMPNELKLRLILKAIIILKNKPLESEFAGHIVADLKLTLILKAIRIIEESKDEDFGLTIDTKDLKLALILKAIDVLEVYDVDFKDTVFFTESKQELKLALILKAIELLKQGNWPIDIDDLWPEVDEEGGDMGSEGTTQAQTTEEVTTPQTTEEVTKPRPVTMVEEPSHKPKHWLKKGISKAFKWFKFIPKVIRKKKHLFFH